MAQPAGQLEEREIYDLLARHMQHHSAQNLIESDEPTSFVCGLCIMPGFGPRYGCRHCEVKIHRICGSRLQKNLPCSFHPTTHWMSLEVVGQGAEICSVCQKYILGLHYKSDCENLRVHPICHNLRFAANTDAAALIPPSNAWLHAQHALQERYLPKQYDCDGCGTNGMGRRFYCGDCGFNLHPYCASCPSVMQPCFLSRDGDVYLLTLPSGQLNCLMCGDPIARTDTAAGLHYCCKGSNDAAHPLCVQLWLTEKAYAAMDGSHNQPDTVAQAFKCAKVVAGALIRHHVYATLLGTAFVGAATFTAMYAQTGDAVEAVQITAEAVQEHVEDVVGDDVDDCGDCLCECLISSLCGC